jgi:OTU domain-containing protein 6
MEAESLESMQKRHRQELKELQGRITNKKKNASKKTRKGVNDECAEMERQLREKQAAETAALSGAAPRDRGEDDEGDEDEKVDDGAGKLGQATEALQISSPAAEEEAQAQGQSSPPAAAAAAGGGSGGKKRNRQKERLARRAAEQEAASERAEEEAANMTDHRARESVYMKKMFESNGLVEQEIAPDGHCLFSAMADQLGQYDVPLEDDRGAEGDASTSTSSSTGSGGEPRFKTVRRAAAAFMQAHADDFAPFLDEDLEAYVAKMRDTAEWGGQLELTALARRYESEIRVIQDGRTERIGEDEGRASGRTLWLAYYRHGYGLGEHYNSLRKTAKAAT